MINKTMAMALLTLGVAMGRSWMDETNKKKKHPRRNFAERTENCFLGDAAFLLAIGSFLLTVELFY